MGTTTVNSWMTIDDVTYGMMPSAKIDMFCSAPPENMLNMPRNEPRAAARDDVAHLDAVDARDRDEHADPVDREHREREQNPPAKLRDLPDI